MTTVQSVISLLNQTKRQGIKLCVEAGKLKYKSRAKIPDNLKSQIVEYKDELIEMLSDCNKLEITSNNKLHSCSLLPFQTDIINAIDISGKKHLYNVPLFIQYKGDFSLELFKNTLLTMLNKHSILNSKIINKDNKFKLIPCKKGVGLDFLEISDCNVDVISYMKDLSNYSFDLVEGPLYHVSIIKKNKNQYYFLFIFHHVIFDGASANLFLNEFSRIYQARCSVDYSNAFSYFDFVNFYQNQKKIYHEQDLMFWKGQIKNIVSTNLSDRESMRLTDKYMGSRFLSTMDVKLSKKIKECLSKYSNVTPFVFFLSIYSLLIRDFCNQDIITVGITTTLRKHHEFINTLGMFVNSLPFGVSTSGHMNLTCFFDKVADHVKKIFKHNSITCTEIAALHELTSTNLFDAMFLYEETAKFNQSFCDGVIERFIVSESDLSKFTLTFIVNKIEENQFSIEIEYNNNLLTEQKIRYLLDGYMELLRQVIKIDTPTISICQLHAISIEQKNQLTETFNNIVFPYQHKTVVQLFKEQLNTSGDTIALRGLSGDLTFYEVDKLSAHLSCWLSLNINNKSKPIALMMTRDIYALVTIMAILRAGYCYLPIDPEYPLERINYILEDSDAALIVVDDKTSRHLPKITLPFINVEAYLKTISSDDLSGNSLNIDYSCLSEPAYIIYTSGSTGKPKGVVIAHHSLSHYIQWSITHYIRNQGSGNLVHSSMSFDLTVTSLFSALCCGKTTYLAHDDFGVEGLLNALRYQQDYSLIKLTPAHLKIIQERLPRDLLSKIATCFVIGGEALYKHHLEMLLTHCNQSIFINEYGPTETTVGAMNFKIKLESIGQLDAIPIGKPIGNYIIYVLDHLMRPVPLGVVGEIYITGIGLSKGYLNNTKFNFDKFINNPYARDSNTQLLYKTGDLAKFSPNGILHYIGRTDDQFKINGYRIETEEVASVLKEIASIKEVVITIEKISETKQLCAYLVPASLEEDLKLDEIKQTVSRRLPIYMRPTIYRCIPNIPLTINAKIDKNQLLKMPYNELKIDVEDHKISYRGKALLEIWRKLFNKNSISASDDFFSLGGDSIMALQLIAKMREMDFNFTIQALYQYQNIYEIDCYLSSLSASIKKEVDDCIAGEIPLTPIQRWFFSQNFNNPNYYYQILPIRLDKKYESYEMRRILDQLLSYIDVSKIRFKYESEKIIQYYLELPIEQCYYYTLIRQDIISAPKSLIEHAYHKIKIQDSPLIHIMHFKSDQRHDALLFIAHHLIIDAYSWSIIKNKLGSILDGKTLKPALSYKKWSITIQSYIQGAKKHFDENNSSDSIQLYKTYFSSEMLHKSLKFPMHFKMQCTKIKNKLSLLSINTGDLVLAALYKSIQCYTAEINVMPITIESYGRAELDPDYDFSNTVGWFTSFYLLNIPLNFRALSDISLMKALASLRKSNTDLGVFQMSQYLNQFSPICFNFLGSISESVFLNNNIKELSLDYFPFPISCKNNSTKGFLLELNCWQENDALKLTVQFNSYLKSLDKTKSFVQDLESVILQFLTLLENASFEALNKIYRLTYFSDATQLLANSKFIKQLYPVLPGQQLMLQQYFKNPKSLGFRTQVFWRVGKNVSANTVEQLWKMLAMKIPELNICFEEKDNIYVQVEQFHNYEYFSFKRSRLYSEDDVINFINSQFPKQFNLEKRSPIRCIFIQYKECCVIVFDHHHVLLDGESIRIVKNMFDNYIQNQNITLDYVDTLQGYHAYQQSTPLCFKNRAHAFWRRYLDMFSGVKTSCKAKKYQSLANSVTHEGFIDHDIDEELRRLIETKVINLKVTTSTIMAYAWGLFLSKHYQKPDIAFGIISSGRSRLKNAELCLGMYMNIVPVRICYQNISLDDSIKTLQMNMNDIMLHDALSLNELEHYANLNSNELINSLYSFEYSLNDTELKFSTITNAPITLLVKWGDNPRLVILYDGEVFRSSDIKTFLSDYLDALDTILRFNSTLN